VIRDAVGKWSTVSYWLDLGNNAEADKSYNQPACSTLIGSPSFTLRNCVTGPSVLPQMFVFVTRRISWARETGVGPKPIAMESPSTQKAYSPAWTTSLASGSFLTWTGVAK